MSERDPRLYLSDILDSGGAIQEFVKGLSFEEFCNDRKTYSAVIREVQLRCQRWNNVHLANIFAILPVMATTR